MSQIEHNDPLNAQILAVSEDQIQGFVREPFLEIARLSGVPVETCSSASGRCSPPARSAACARR